MVEQPFGVKPPQFANRKPYAVESLSGRTPDRPPHLTKRLLAELPTGLRADGGGSAGWPNRHRLTTGPLVLWLCRLKASPHTLRHQAITWLTRHSGLADAELQLITSPWTATWSRSTKRRGRRSICEAGLSRAERDRFLNHNALMSTCKARS
jgi:hypothetical protein